MGPYDQMLCLFAASGLRRYDQIRGTGGPGVTTGEDGGKVGVGPAPVGGRLCGPGPRPRVVFAAPVGGRLREPPKDSGFLRRGSCHWGRDQATSLVEG